MTSFMGLNQLDLNKKNKKKQKIKYLEKVGKRF